MILSGAILVAGVMYWLWSHIQLTQKKVQILENAVFELRGMLTSGAATGPPAAGPLTGSSGASVIDGIAAAAGSTVPSPSKLYSDLADDAAEDWADEGDEDVRVIKEIAQVSTPLETVIPALAVEEKTVALEREEEIPDDLIPGGRIQIGGDVVTETESDEKQFKDLFAATAPTATSVAGPRTPESLESMPVKELRRLAAQRGIQGAEDMKKKEILAALRRQVSAPSVAVAAAAVTVEKTLDISEVIGAVATSEDVSAEAEILE